MGNDLPETLVGCRVAPKCDIRGDRRFSTIAAGTTLVVSKVFGQFVNLDWPDGKRAANQVYYRDLRTA